MAQKPKDTTLQHGKRRWSTGIAPKQEAQAWSAHYGGRSILDYINVNIDGGWKLIRVSFRRAGLFLGFTYVSASRVFSSAQGLDAGICGRARQASGCRIEAC
jgi:hypothetical protein